MKFVKRNGDYLLMINVIKMFLMSPVTIIFCDSQGFAGILAFAVYH